MRTNAGYTIVYAYKLKDDEEIVLGRTEDSKQFVTWMTKGESYFWGHYFNNEVAAIKDLINRIDEWEAQYGQQ